MQDGGSFFEASGGKWSSYSGAPSLDGCLFGCRTTCATNYLDLQEAQNNGPMSQNTECRQYRVHYAGPFELQTTLQNTDTELSEASPCCAVEDPKMALLRIPRLLTSGS